jgi:hypothetical protein
LKKRVSQNGGICTEKVTSETTRIISSFANGQEVFQALLPSQPPPFANLHTTDWISKSLSRDYKCGNDQYTIPNSKMSPTKDLPPQLPEYHRKGSYGSLRTSNDSAVPGEVLSHRSSSSKTKFSELNFGDPSFGLKTKPASKKRLRSDEATPPEKSSSKKEDQEDSFARHLIRKRMKFSDLHLTRSEIPSDTQFELNYNLSEDEDFSDSDRQPWTLLSDSVTLKRAVTAEISEIPLKRSQSSILAENDEDTQPCSIPPLVRSSSSKPDITTKRDELSPTKSPSKDPGAAKEEEIWFTGSELPRVLEGVRAAEQDDTEDPKFYALLKPVPKQSDKALEDEIRYQGTWADRLHRQFAAAINEAFSSDVEFDEGNDAEEAIILKGKNPVLNADADNDFQENDFSESQVAFDLSDFGKNFGHSHKPLSAYWERQRKNLACQKLPPDHPSISGSKGSETAPVIPIKENHNKLVTDQLEKLEAICLGSGDKWRGYAIEKQPIS